MVSLAGVDEPRQREKDALQGKRVLIVEDNGLLYYALEQTLREIGCEIEAMEQATVQEFDVALLDINLRGQLVCPLADQLRERGVPFLLTSAYHATDLPRALEHDIQIRKPFTDADLLTNLASLLRRH